MIQRRSRSATDSFFPFIRKLLFVLLSCFPVWGDGAPAFVAQSNLISPEVLHLGNVIPGQSASGILTIRNQSRSLSVDITFLRTSNPRLRADLSSTHLPPKGEVELKVEY